MPATSLYSGSQSGGGVYCDSPANCVLVETNVGTSYTPWHLHMSVDEHGWKN